ncbi:Tetratricopeptide TPR_2 repeat protein [Planctopirus limnophila DSM 3776]|uniref:Tetratricopeptide TPR_2 repeat protein n=2 Tax=Planctopirus limnophila TaxID=120 RepID=D5STM9_PLAL2|nr:Tetratricopeptide TPR_2 repeat protein [Planctopirus limnophila DSM 3776]
MQNSFLDITRCLEEFLVRIPVFNCVPWYGVAGVERPREPPDSAENRWGVEDSTPATRRAVVSWNLYCSTRLSTSFVPMLGSKPQSVSASMSNLFPRLLILLAGIAAYLVGLAADFTFDGVEFVANNQVLDRLWPPEYLSKYTRPFSFLTFAINKVCFGPAPFSFALTNILIHIASAQILYSFVKIVLEKAPRIPESLSRAAVPIALVSSLLWVVHPLNSQGVAYLIQRQESLASLFYLGTMAAFASAVLHQQRSWYLVACISCALGMFSKEILVTAPLCVLWLDLAVLSKSWREVTRRWYWHLALWLTLGLLALVMLSHQGEYAQAGIGDVPDVSRWQYFRSQPWVVATYVKLWFWPTGQCADALLIPINNPAIYWPGLVIASLCLIILWRMSFHRPALGFLLGAWLLVLLPTSSIVPIQDLYFEHRMYLPSMFLAVATTLMLKRLTDRWQFKSQALRWGLVGSMICLLILINNYRCTVYLSDEAFWRDVIAKSPNNSRAYTNLALQIVKRASRESASLDKQKVLEEAIVMARRSFEIHPLNAVSYQNLAFVLGEANRKEEGEKYVQMARILKTRMTQQELLDFGNSNRATEPELALFCYERARELPPESSEVYNNLGILTQQVEKNFVKAEVCFQKSLSINPNNPNTYNSYGNLLVRTKRYQEAVAAFEKALRLDPQLKSAVQGREVAIRLLTQSQNK